MVNAFWLDRDPERIATWLVDPHVPSGVFEGSMVLATAVQLNGYDPGNDHALYFSHESHPLTRWAAAAYENWRMLYAYTEAVHREWRYRWDHGPSERHRSWAVVRSIERGALPTLAWPNGRGADPPQLTGGWTADDYVDAYRYYYANEKRHLFRWSKDRTMPPWIDEYTVDEGTE